MLTIDPVRADAYTASAEHLADVFANGRSDYAIPAGAVKDPTARRELAAFVFWSAWAATTEFKVNYLAPVTTGVLAATARIVSMTRRTAVVRIDVENEGRLVCAAQGTVLIMQPKSQ